MQLKSLMDSHIASKIYSTNIHDIVFRTKNLINFNQKIITKRFMREN